MKINKFKFSLLSLFAVISTYTFVSADTINCKDSFAPRFLCETYADWTTNFSINTIIRMLLTILIAVLVIYVLFQIIKAVFEWIGKSNDDKARAAAIKSISNAVVGGIVVIVLLVATFIFTNILNTSDTPNPLYACYPSNIFVANDINASTVSLASGVSKTELSGVTAYERKSALNRNVSQGGEVFASSVNETYNILHGFFYKGTTKNPTTGTGSLSNAGTLDDNEVDFIQNNLYCVDRDTGKEHSTGYVILKRIGVTK